MAALILSQIGSNLFGTIGGFIGALAGARIDAVAGAALAPTRVMPSRLKSLSVQASQEGEPIPLVHGRARITGQVVWASKFRETSTARRVGGKTGQRVVERHYDISFAIGLCEGPIRGIGRVWANGDPLDMSALNWRLLPGGPDQMPDPLIEAIEGLDRAPAHRGLATIVFEDFPLDGFGDRIPQLSFEVFTQTAVDGEPGSLEALARGVNLIPACGEFVYATTPIRTVLRPGRERVENLNASAGRTDFMVALDNLQRDLPGVDHVSLAVAWFGDDLRCGSCQVMPRAEVRGKINRPFSWSVAGLTRATAPVVSTVDWRPALGGTPADFCVIEALRELKRRGFKVTLHPFLLMDIPAASVLPAPTGGTQPPYPWRGRISCHPAPGRAGSPDGAAAADAQVQAFFGTAGPGQMTVSTSGTGSVSWQAGTSWGYRRFVLHLAGLALAAGGVDGFLLGSELCGLTRVRGAGGVFPAVEALRTLAVEVRGLLGPATVLSYAADWTEYGAQVPADDPFGLVFPLDTLWADPVVDCVSVDWYPPLADQRPGEGRPTRAELEAGMASGEAHDWYYASDADRAAGIRSPIQDSGHGEPWVWRQKDIRGWWLNAHHPRAGGIRAAIPTAWQPGMKPVRLMELGFPAVDRGANRPSAFPDPKSVESVLPPFSTGARDDAAQRTALEAALAWWQTPGNNPLSPTTAAPMLDPAHTHLWCWDARPYPQFPARADLWADGPNAATGHWLAGRAGAVSLGAVLADLAGRTGVSIDVSGVEGTLEGHVLAGTTPVREALAILALAFGLEAHTRPDGTPALRTTPDPVPADSLGPEALTRRDNGLVQLAEHDLASGPAAARVETWSSERALQPATARAGAVGGGLGTTALAVPIVSDDGLGRAIATRLATIAGLPREQLQVTVGPAAGLAIEPGDRLALGDGRVWRVEAVEGALAPDLTLVPAPPRGIAPMTGFAPGSIEPPPVPAAPLLRVLDLPAPFTDPADPRPLLAVAADPWGGSVAVLANGSPAATLSTPARIGELVTPLVAGRAGVTLPGAVEIELWCGALGSASGMAAVLDGAGQVLDVLAWRRAALVAARRWRLSGVWRGLSGAAAPPPLAAGSEVVVLDGALARGTLAPGLGGTWISWQARASASAWPDDEVELTALWQGLAAQPWSPVHLRAVRTPAGVRLSWIRRARGDGDAFDPPDVPPASVSQLFRIEIQSTAGSTLRTLTTKVPELVYPSADELADFGAVQGRLQVAVCEIGDGGRVGVVASALLEVRTGGLI